MPDNVASALSFIVGSIGQLYAFVLILRFLLPFARADLGNRSKSACCRTRRAEGGTQGAETPAVAAGSGRDRDYFCARFGIRQR